MALVLFTGGARSGKSAAAEALALSRSREGQSVTVAVFGRECPTDAEFVARIERHRADRPEAFRTLEVSSASDWLGGVAEEELLLLDCLGTLLGLVMEEVWPAGGMHDAAPDELPDGYADDIVRRFTDIVTALLARRGDAIVVTNEVGDGIVPQWASGRLFRDVLGRANRRIATRADAAYLVVAGRLIDLAALPEQAAWPED